MSTATSTGTDPIGATLMFSLLLHGALLLGITFQFVKPKPSLPTLDVTLVNVANRQAPDKADFLAQANNRGGGQSDTAARPSEMFSGALPIPNPGTAVQSMEAATPAPQPSTATRLLTTTGHSDFRVASDTTRPVPDAPDTATPADELRRKQEMAKLAAELRNRKEAYAKRPKIKYLTASTREYAYAAYMRGWIDRVERVGNLNYPDEARRQGLHGDVELTVVLNRDGSILQIAVIRSSGHALLDTAAQRIVRLAAPFPPVPADNHPVDQLNITRTWQFLPGDILRHR